MTSAVAGVAVQCWAYLAVWRGTPPWAAPPVVTGAFGVHGMEGVKGYSNLM
jgi:hypothetical protein